MQQEIRFATFNVCNLALPGMQFYDNLPPFTPAEYDAKITWIAQQLDALNADVIGFQEIFSQAALKDVLARTKNYQQTHHIGIDPDPNLRLTPSVALVSRLPLAAAATMTSDLPRNLSVAIPDVQERFSKFTRPVLHAQIRAPNGLIVHVVVTHLKSKRPDYRNGEQEDDPYQLGIASLRSLIRRGAEALGLRYLVLDLMQNQRAPVVVMGDFNDIAASVTTQLVMGVGGHSNLELHDRLFDSYGMRLCHRSARDVAYTHTHGDIYDTVDHILVSEEFNPASERAVGEVLEVIYLNDHVTLRLPEASDHGMVMVRIGLDDINDVANNGVTP
ncbi:MAG: endonuclease/exonuclease/phosphatase family protein [Burkholderiaceae bacterium]